LIHSSRFFLSDVEEVVWGNESGVGILFGLVVVFCFFNGSDRVGVGDVEWNVFRFTCCFVSATLASSANGDDVERSCRSGLISRGVGSERVSLVIDVSPEHRFFIINWDHDCFVVDVDGVKGFPWSPSGPVVDDVKVSSSNKGTEEVELIVVSMHVDEDDAIIGTQGEDSRGSKS